MPFEIAPQKQSAAEKLAALIEAGRAANPNMKHLHGVHGGWGNGRDAGCAMTFALKAAGVDLSSLHLGSIAVYAQLSEITGIELNELRDLAKRVINANDNDDASIEQITEGLRAGTLKIPTYASLVIGKWVGATELAKMYDVPASPEIIVTYYGDYLNFDSAILKPKKIAKARPAKKVRTSAKNGATWPVAKHCYA